MTNEEMFKANMGIAYKIANTYRINYSKEYEDIKQVALLGLWKAVLTFKHTHAFSTYAYPVISNEINSYLRKDKKEEKDISMETVVTDNITIADMLEEKENCIKKIEDEEEIRELKERFLQILNTLKQREKTICLLMLKGKTQREIAKQVNYSRANVQRIEKKIKEKLLKLIEVS